MFKLKEILIVVLFSILLGALISLRADFSILFSSILLGILSFFIVISINIIAKKLAARYLDSSIEIKTWSFKQYWFTSSSHLKNEFPIGILLPIISTILSLGYFVWLAVIEFDPSPLSSRVSKRHGLYRFSELTEIHICLIAAAGVSANLLLSIPFYLFNFTELAKISIYFAFWNLIPLGNLDGSKIFFGSRIVWISLLIISAIFLSYALLLV